MEPEEFADKYRLAQLSSILSGVDTLRDHPAMTVLMRLVKEMEDGGTELNSIFRPLVPVSLLDSSEKNRFYLAANPLRINDERFPGDIIVFLDSTMVAPVLSEGKFYLLKKDREYRFDIDHKSSYHKRFVDKLLDKQNSSVCKIVDIPDYDEQIGNVGPEITNLLKQTGSFFLEIDKKGDITYSKTTTFDQSKLKYTGEAIISQLEQDHIQTAQKSLKIDDKTSKYMEKAKRLGEQIIEYNEIIKE